MDSLKPPEAIDFQSANLAEVWRKWDQKFRTYYTACELDKKAKGTQIAILLHTAGCEAQEIHKSFVFGSEEDAEKYDTVLAKFKEYCEPRKNIVFERYQFWTRNQMEGETVNQWLKELRARAERCEFGQENVQSMIRDKIVFGVRKSQRKASERA